MVYLFVFIITIPFPLKALLFLTIQLSEQFLNAKPRELIYEHGWIQLFVCLFIKSSFFNDFLLKNFD